MMPNTFVPVVSHCICNNLKLTVTKRVLVVLAFIKVLMECRECHGCHEVVSHKCCKCSEKDIIVMKELEGITTDCMSDQ